MQGVDQFTDGFDANHAVLLKHGIVNIVGTRHRAGMGIGGVGAQRAAAYLQNHDRLFQAYPAKRRRKAFAIVVALHIDTDHARAFVRLEIFQ
ncbi:hypothetical protein SDC9_85980 [bioreactor metagenome]|uniref:Uncharacterized protein n=1 Tax=bioreactor metagenome TaxID=1076179 RepID=A0A644ZF60_9ZZZZ